MLMLYNNGSFLLRFLHKRRTLEVARSREVDLEYSTNVKSGTDIPGAGIN